LPISDWYVLAIGIIANRPNRQSEIKNRK